MDENSISKPKRTQNTNRKDRSTAPIGVRIPRGRKEQIAEYIDRTETYASVSDFCRDAILRRIDSLIEEGKISERI